MLFYPIILPWPILLHAVWLTAHGCSKLISTPDEKNPEDTSTLGTAMVGLGMSYLATSYMPIEENQFLCASVPVRILLASLSGLKWLTIARNPRVSRLYKNYNALLGVFLYDGLGGLILGWYLGTFGGKVLSHR